MAYLTQPRKKLEEEMKRYQDVYKSPYERSIERAERIERIERKKVLTRLEKDIYKELNRKHTKRDEDYLIGELQDIHDAIRIEELRDKLSRIGAPPVPEEELEEQLAEIEMETEEQLDRRLRQKAVNDLMEYYKTKPFKSIFY